MSIEIANESGVEVDESHLAGLARHVLDDMRVHPLAELSVLLVDEPAMTELHMRWMGEEGPTDVLAFPMDELRLPQPGGTHSDHATPDPDAAEVLLGYDHGEPEEHSKMFGLQDRLLASWRAGDGRASPEGPG